MKTLSPEEVFALHERGEIHLVDVREDNEWAQARIPGAIHAPLSRLVDLAPELPDDKPVVFHCLAGGRSAKAVGLAAALGLPHDSHMDGGLGAWHQAGFPVDR
ncbi:rhodanese-like domain-containing protein [Methylobrevis pamukkalensis]|uniref:Inner membrane protein YgaP n=1 Tax=Methylobrevis pamukkalensis TaxID=1439726 RepID=A0A1E3H5U2_9HYPH|nr:rhodanese-like domain-containing protein [Methylobrevis pamukkalensis]ODN70891.1 Inner membrane protein YgaP [Methylobrevis pamukkalensis]